VPYVAAVVLRVGGARVEPGDDVTAAVSTWGASSVENSLRAGTIVFVPPQLLGAVDVAPAQAASPAPGANPQKKRR